MRVCLTSSWSSDNGAVQIPTQFQEPMCLLNDGIEDTEHFLLLCPSFDLQRRDLFAGVLAILRPFGHNNLSNKVLTQYLLYGNKDLSIDLNREIVKLTLAFIHTGRID